MKCVICKKDIEEGEQIYQLRFGSLNKDEFGGVGFDEVQSLSVHGYVHYTCFEKD